MSNQYHKIKVDHNVLFTMHEHNGRKVEIKTIGGDYLIDYHQVAEGYYWRKEGVASRGDLTDAVAFAESYLNRGQQPHY